MSMRISVLQLFCIVALSTGVSNHVLLIPLMLQAGKRDTWLAVLMTLLLVAPVCLLLYKLLRQTGKEGLTGLLESRYGFFVSSLVKAPLFIFAYGFMFIALKETTTWINVTYLPQTPAFAITLSIIVLCVLIALSGLRTLAILSGILLPFVCVFGMFITFATLRYTDYSLLFPLFTHGFLPAAHSAAYAATGLFELVFLLVAARHVKQRFKRWHVIVLGAVIIGLTVGPVVGAISIFGPFEAADLRYPTFEQWRMAMLGKFITRLDSLSVYQWLSGIVARISFYILVMLELLPSGLSNSNRPLRRPLAVLLIGGSAGALSVAPLSDVLFLELLQRYFLPGWLAVCAALACALLFVTRRSAQRGEVS